jgi:hypothetical protein
MAPVIPAYMDPFNLLIGFVLFAVVVLLLSFATCREPWGSAGDVQDGGWTVDAADDSRR